MRTTKRIPEIEITTGAYWFYRRDLDRCGMNMEILLKDETDGAVLQETVTRTIRRLPCLGLTRRKSEDNTRYLLVPNDQPFAVFQKNGFVGLESPEGAGFLWSLAYNKNRWYLRVFHGLTDGMGMAAIMKHLLIFYFSILNHDPLPPEMADPETESLDGPTYADPFDFARKTDQTYEFHEPEPFLFTPEDEKTRVPIHRNLYLYLHEVLDAKRISEGSVSGMITLLLARALDRINGDPAKTVVVKCPVNLRGMLGCTRTLQNCVSSFKYVFSDAVKKMSKPQQASCFAGMLMSQTTEESLMNSFSDWKEEIRKFNRESSIKEKRERMNTSETMYPMVSYLGSFSVGAYDRFIKGFDFSMDLGGAIGIMAMTFGDAFYISLNLTKEKEFFVQVLTDELDSLGINYRLE